MKTKTQQFYSMPQVVETLGIPYHRVYRAVITHVVKPMRSGHSRIFTNDDVLTLRRYFDERDTKGDE